MYIQQIFFYIMLGIECVLLIPFLMNFSKLEKSGRIIFYYLISAIVFAAGSQIIASIWKNNLWFWNSMYFIQFVIFSIYFHEIIKSKPIRLVTVILMLPILGFTILDYLVLEGPHAYNSYAVAVDTLILMVYSVLFFWQLLRDEGLVKQSIFINSLPDFWYNAGIFIFHCGFFLFSLSYNIRLFKGTTLLQRTPDTILAITFIAGIIQLILLYIGLLKAKRIRP